MADVVLIDRLLRWRHALPSEIRFWDDWFRTGGLDWPEDFKARARFDRPFPDNLVGYLSSPRTDRVLDVGAGPMSVLGPDLKGARINLTACDPLAPIYSLIADRYATPRPTVTEQAFAEDLSARFDEATFELVYCRNALDHSFEPLRGLEEMLIVCKTDGHVVLEHSTNEAEHENYTGLHQWNFDEDQGRFIIWNRSERIDVSLALAGLADITTTKHDRYHSVVMRKKVEVWPYRLRSRTRSRLSEFLAGLVAIDPSALPVRETA